MYLCKLKIFHFSCVPFWEVVHLMLQGVKEQCVVPCPPSHHGCCISQGHILIWSISLCTLVPSWIVSVQIFSVVNHEGSEVPFLLVWDLLVSLQSNLCFTGYVRLSPRLLIAINRRGGPAVAKQTVKLAEEFLLSTDGVVVGLDLSGDPTVSFCFVLICP